MYETTKEDIRQAQQGNQEIMTQIIQQNSGLVWSIIKRFNGRGYDAEELYQIGCIGFIKAIKRFDANFEVKLSTYAVPYILGEIKRFLRDDGPIKVSRSVKELSIKIKEVQKEYWNNKGEEVSIGQIAKILNIAKEDVAFAMESDKPIESIYEEAYQDGGENSVNKIEKIDMGIDESNKLIEQLSLKQLIDNLESREKKIIELRFYQEKTQTEVANLLGITQVQVSRIEKKILSSMRRKLIS